MIEQRAKGQEDLLVLALRFDFAASGLTFEKWVGGLFRKFFGDYRCTVDDVDRDALIASWNLPASPDAAMQEITQAIRRQLGPAEGGQIIEAIALAREE